MNAEEGNLSVKEEALQQKLEFLNEDLGEETVVELSEVFIESTKEIINKLNNASTAGDYLSIRNLVHSLRGNSGTFGFEPLVTACKELEIKINDSCLDGVDVLLAKVIAEVNENVFILKKMLNK